MFLVIILLEACKLRVLGFSKVRVYRLAEVRTLGTCMG
jgi:hypothetical protein